MGVPMNTPAKRANQSIFFVLTFIILLLSASIASAQYTMYELEIPVPGDTWLAADLYTPDIDAALPIIFIQTPYNKESFRHHPLPLETDNLAWVVMDWRGFYGSAHAAVRLPFYGEDGAAAIEWMAEQPWSNGRIGMYGGSALGAIQYLTAQYRPEHLVCAVPINHASQIRYLKYYHGGVKRTEFVGSLGGWQPVSFFVDRHPYHDWFWNFTERLSDYTHKIDVPMLVISGWWDMSPDEAIMCYQDLRERTRTDIRDHHRLLMGPWSHSTVGHLHQGIWTFPTAVNVGKLETIEFFNHWLMQDESVIYNPAPVRYFDLGNDEFLEAENWPPTENEDRHLYFVEEELSETPPAGPNDSRIFDYDPRSPVPTLGGRLFANFLNPGPGNLTPLDGRTDMLVYETDVLTEPIEMRGYIRSNVFVSTNRLDTDVMVILADVFPNGDVRFITDGARRLRFRSGFGNQQLAIPGQIYELEVPMQVMSASFLPGHKVRLYVSGSNYPRFDRNLNNGGEMYAEGDTLIASTTIHQDAVRPSSLVFASPVEGAIAIADLDASRAKSADGNAIEVSAYPNPFNALTTVSVTLPHATALRIELYNVAGQRVQVIADGRYSAGTHGYSVDASDLASGVYFIHTIIPDTPGIVRKLMLIK
jgi:uncharacterized protein